MKRTLILLLFAIGFTAHAQTTEAVSSKKFTNFEAKVDSLLLQIDTLMMVNNELVNSVNSICRNNLYCQRFKLYQTENVYTLLQLDTKTGIVEQLQWSLESSSEGSFDINSRDLGAYGYLPGSFELYPTKNMYQFILLDKTTGLRWHIQWGMKDSERWIRQIF